MYREEVVQFAEYCLLYCTRPGFAPQHHIKLSVVVHACNPSSQIVEPDRKLRVIIAYG